MKFMKTILFHPPFIAMLSGITIMLPVSIFGQNHNPHFSVSDININGSDYVLVPPDSNANAVQTSVEVRYRNDDIPTDGDTVLSEAGNSDVSVYEGGSVLTPMPHTWSDNDQGNKDLGLEATHSANLGTEKELYVRYDPPDGGTSSPSQYKYYTMLKLDLISPAGGDHNDPENNPIDGGDGAGSSVTDGANEFTFPSASNGVLTIQFKAGATGISDLNSIVGDVTFSIDNVGQAPTWATGNSGGQATVSGNHLVATATFTGLPSSNSGFGEKTVKLLYDGDVVEEKVIEVFYPRDADNHPGGDQTPASSGSSRAPNWFYYWNDAIGSSSVLFNDDMDLHLFTRAYGMVPAMYHWDINMTYSKTEIWISDEVVTSATRYDGSNQTASGIDWFANVLAHEEHHVQQISDADALLGNLNGQAGTIFAKGWSFNAGGFHGANYNHFSLGSGDKPGRPNHNDDGDGTIDELSDRSEIDHVSTDDSHLDSDEDDIPNSWEPQDGVEDGAEAAETITEDTHWESDWGDPGKQHETKQVYND